jgi:hypothetical protein
MDRFQTACVPSQIQSPGGHTGWKPSSDTIDGDDDLTTPTRIKASSLSLSTQLDCMKKGSKGSAASPDLQCLQSLPYSKVYSAAGRIHFAPALESKDDGAADFPVRRFRLGQWNSKIPVIVGGQSCESCGAALAAFGEVMRLFESPEMA